MVVGPHVNGATIRLRTCIDAEGVEVKRWPDGFELEAADPLRGRMASDQIDQQRGNQWAMHDEARVTLHFRDIAPIVVDAVAIERSAQSNGTAAHHRA